MCLQSFSIGSQYMKMKGTSCGRCCLCFWLMSSRYHCESLQWGCKQRANWLLLQVQELPRGPALPTTTVLNATALPRKWDGRGPSTQPATALVSHPGHCSPHLTAPRPPLPLHSPPPFSPAHLPSSTPPPSPPTDTSLCLSSSSSISRYSNPPTYLPPPPPLYSFPSSRLPLTASLPPAPTSRYPPPPSFNFLLQHFCFSSTYSPPLSALLLPFTPPLSPFLVLPPLFHLLLLFVVHPYLCLPFFLPFLALPTPPPYPPPSSTLFFLHRLCIYIHHLLPLSSPPNFLYLLLLLSFTVSSSCPSSFTASWRLPPLPLPHPAERGDEKEDGALAGAEELFGTTSESDTSTFHGFEDDELEEAATNGNGISSRHR